MDIVISHMAALHLIRGMAGPFSQWEACDTALPKRLPTAEELRKARARCPELGGIDGPVGVLIATKTASRKCDHIVPHVRSENLPKGALFRLAPGVRCVSPLLLPVLLAGKLTFLEMQLLLAELLGLYAVSDQNPMGLIQREKPLITVDELRAFLKQIGPVWGSGKVSRALDRAAVLAASPQEAKLYLRMTLPFAKGGYHLGKVVLNDEVSLAMLSRRIKTLSTRKPDLLFVGAEKGGVCLDYMGAWHDDPEQVRRDTQRRNELLANGFTPYEIFKAQYDDLDYMDGLAESIRSDLGISPPDVAPERQMRRRLARYNLWRKLERIDLLAWETRPELR